MTSGGMYTQALPVLDPDFERGEYTGAVAYARSKRGQVELLPVLARRWATAPGSPCTPRTRVGRHTRPGRLAPPVRRRLRPVLRSDAAGTDTTTWVVATEPAPASGRLWHDRRPRPTSVLGRTRPTEDERTRFWDVGCRRHRPDRLLLPAHPRWVTSRQPNLPTVGN